MGNRKHARGRIVKWTATTGLALLIPVGALLADGPSNSLRRASTQTAAQPKAAAPKAKQAWIGNFRRGLGGFLHRDKVAHDPFQNEAVRSAPQVSEASAPESGVVSAGAEFDAGVTPTGIVRSSANWSVAACRSSRSTPTGTGTTRRNASRPTRSS